MSALATGTRVSAEQHSQYLLSLADRAMILGQRLCGLVTHLPDFDEDLAISNIALDLVGQARALYAHAAEIESKGRSEDDLAFLRGAAEFRSPLLAEQGGRDFADVIVRQFLHDRFANLLWDALQASSDPILAGIAAKAVKETRYHCRYGTEWMIRLGDGTPFSHDKMQASLDFLWPYVTELFDNASVAPEMIAAGIAVDPTALWPSYQTEVDLVLSDAKLTRPASIDNAPARSGNFDDLAAILQVMQAEYRAHPGAEW